MSVWVDGIDVGYALVDNFADTLVVDGILAAVVQDCVELERVVFPHVVDHAHARVLLYVYINGSRLGVDHELAMRKGGGRTCPNRHLHRGLDHPPPLC